MIKIYYKAVETLIWLFIAFLSVLTIYTWNAAFNGLGIDILLDIQNWFAYIILKLIIA